MVPPPANPGASLPSPTIPANPPNRTAGAPLVHFHPSTLYSLRDRITVKSTAWSLIRPMVKKVILDPAVHSVTYSKKVGPGGPHAFLSYAPHFHPNKAALEEYLKQHPGAKQDEWEDRIPWDREDGNRTSEGGGATQANELAAMCEKVWLLAVTWHFAQKLYPDGAEQYAKKAFELLYTFFGDPTTMMIPEVEYGQYVRGSQSKVPYRPEGLLHVRPLVAVSQVLPLLPGPPSPWSPHAFMHPWLEKHVYFLQNHQVGKMAMTRHNNIQTHYYVQLTTHLLALNRAVEAHSLITNLFFPSPSNSHSLSTKIDSEGVLIHEVKRPKPFHYTCFELEPLTFLADLATSIQPPLPDVWCAENHALKRATDQAVAYFLRSSLPATSRPPLPKSVPKEVENGADLRSLVFQLRSVSKRYYGKGEYEWLVGKGGEKAMEEGQVELLKGWNQGARLKWALLES